MKTQQLAQLQQEVAELLKPTFSPDQYVSEPIIDGGAGIQLMFPGRNVEWRLLEGTKRIAEKFNCSWILMQEGPHGYVIWIQSNENRGELEDHLTEDEVLDLFISPVDGSGKKQAAFLSIIATQKFGPMSYSEMFNLCIEEVKKEAGLSD